MVVVLITVVVVVNHEAPFASFVLAFSAQSSYRQAGARWKEQERQKREGNGRERRG